MPLSSFAQKSCEHDENNLRCVKYVRNYDADTVTFNIPKVHPLLGKKVNIRVSGVDTPEIRTKNKCEKEKARNAKKLVANLFKHAKRIDLENIKRGKYFRIVADVIIDGKSLTYYLTVTKVKSNRHLQSVGYLVFFINLTNKRKIMILRIK